MAISAVIPVRGGSTRIKDKNIRPFSGSSLLEVKIEQLKRIKSIDEIIVSSDSELMLEIAKKHGVVASRRPDEFCDEKSRTFNQVVEYVATNEVKTEEMIWAPCVCPLLQDKSIIEGIEIYKKIKNGEIYGDSVVSAQLFKEYIFDEYGPINFSIENHVPSQKLPRWHVIQNGFYIAETNKMANWKFVYGPNPYLYEISKLEALDIDDMLEFEMAEFFFNKIENINKEI